MQLDTRRGAEPSLQHREQLAKISVQTRMPEKRVSPGSTESSLPILVPSSQQSPMSCQCCTRGCHVLPDIPSWNQLKLRLLVLHSSKPPCHSSPGTLHCCCCLTHSPPAGSHLQPSLYSLSPGSWLILPVSPAHAQPSHCFQCLLCHISPAIQGRFRTMNPS